MDTPFSVRTRGLVQESTSTCQPCEAPHASRPQVKLFRNNQVVVVLWTTTESDISLSISSLRTSNKLLSPGQSDGVQSRVNKAKLLVD